MKKIIIATSLTLSMIISCCVAFAAPIYDDEATVNIDTVSGKPKITVVSTNINKTGLAPGDIVHLKVNINNNTGQKVDMQYIDGSIKDNIVPNSDFNIEIIASGKTIYNSVMGIQAVAPVSTIQANGKLSYDINAVLNKTARNVNMNKTVTMMLKFSVASTGGSNLNIDKIATGSMMLIYIVCAVALLCIALILLIILIKRKNSDEAEENDIIDDDVMDISTKTEDDDLEKTYKSPEDIEKDIEDKRRVQAEDNGRDFLNDDYRRIQAEDNGYNMDIEEGIMRNNGGGGDGDEGFVSADDTEDMMDSNLD